MTQIVVHPKSTKCFPTRTNKTKKKILLVKLLFAKLYILNFVIFLFSKYLNFRKKY